MGLLRLRVLLHLLISCCCLIGVASAQQMSRALPPGVGWAAVAARTLPATVNVQVSTLALSDTDPLTGEKTVAGERSRIVGSGFIIDPSGLIVTNKHVIDGAMSINVKLQDGTEAPAVVLSAAPLIDLALLKIDVGHPLPFLKFGNGDSVKPGDPVMAIGNPLGVGTSLSVGVVSGTRRNLMNSPFDDYIQTDAAINHGNSGGPLVNSAGEVIGVDSTLYTNQANEGSNGVGFAISSTIVSMVVDHMLHPPPRFGWSGLYLQTMTPDISRSFGAPGKGAIVARVEANSAASAAGIKPGDVILSLNNKALDDGQDLVIRIAASPIGSSALLKVWSAGKIHDVRITVRAWPGSYGLATANLQNPSCLPHDTDLGLLFEPITPLERQIYELGDESGLLVASVNPMSEAYGRGFRAGVVIKQINDQTPTTREEATRILKAAAERSPVVSLLVSWSQGVEWISLHTSYSEKPSATKGGSGTMIPLCPANSTAAVDDNTDAGATQR